MDFNFKEVDVCVYHRACHDGFCCAYLVWNILGGKGQREIDFIPMNPSTKIDQADLDRFSGKRVLIVDLSFSRDDLFAIQKVASEVIVIDHHKTAAADLGDLPFAVFDMNYSGAGLLWKVLIEYFKKQGQAAQVADPEFPPMLAQYVQDRDLWKWKLPQSNEINAWLQTVPFEFETWYQADLLLGNPETLGKVASNGTVILNTQQRMVDELAGYAALVELWIGPEKLHSVKARVVNCPVKELISMTGHTILELEEAKPEKERVEVAVLYTLFPDGGLLFSIRSARSFDSSVIAKAWGGGGHAQACGFKGSLEEGFPWNLIEEHN